MTKRTPEQVATETTNAIIQAIEAGINGDSWERPWNLTGVFPTNPNTGNDYRGAMSILLMLMIHGGGNFAGYGQWGKIGGQVRKGEKSLMILRPATKCVGEDAKGKKIMIPTGQYFYVPVFHESQQEGWIAPVIESNDNFIDHAKAEGTIQAMMDSGVSVKHGGDTACFIPSIDSIRMPCKEQFLNESDYYATILHELVHWTGRSDRLNRNKAYGDKRSYAFEELVAELGASMLCGELGVHNGYRDDHAKYVSHWLDIMRGDSNAILDAAKLAGIAVDVIMNRRELDGTWIDRDKHGDVVQEDIKAAA